MLDEGPLPDGMRYCVSGVALKFIPDSETNRMRANVLREKAKTSPMELNMEDWKLILTPEQFRITRMRQNEDPFSSGLEKMNLDEEGIFRCLFHRQASRISLSHSLPRHSPNFLF